MVFFSFSDSWISGKSFDARWINLCQTKSEIADSLLDARTPSLVVSSRETAIFLGDRVAGAFCFYKPTLPYVIKSCDRRDIARPVFNPNLSKLTQPSPIEFFETQRVFAFLNYSFLCRISHHLDFLSSISTVKVDLSCGDESSGIFS